MSLVRTLSALTALATTAFAFAACSTDSPTEAPMQMSSSAMLDKSNAHQGAETGTTAGWEGGKTVTFFYSKNFFCQQPPTSGATSQCELGADAETPPRSGPLPILYVLVPLGFTPDVSTLQCPVAGSCIDHPSTIDLSRVFGAGTENAALPPHSHVIGDEAGASKANGGWWDVEVIGVQSPAAWAQIVAGKSLETVRALQGTTGSGVTGDIPTNLSLFFSVRP